MHRFQIVANTVRVRLVGFADWLYGCSHRRTTLPFPPIFTTLRPEGTDRR